MCFPLHTVTFIDQKFPFDEKKHWSAKSEAQVMQALKLKHLFYANERFHGQHYTFCSERKNWYFSSIVMCPLHTFVPDRAFLHARHSTFSIKGCHARRFLRKTKFNIPCCCTVKAPHISESFLFQKMAGSGLAFAGALLLLGKSDLFLLNSKTHFQNSLFALFYTMDQRQFLKMKWAVSMVFYWNQKIPLQQKIRSFFIFEKNSNDFRQKYSKMCNKICSICLQNKFKRFSSKNILKCATKFAQFVYKKNSNGFRQKIF